MFVALHIADFALHAVLRTEPNAAPRAAALFSSSRQKSLVTAATATARAAGVALGMSAPQAVARCPELMIRAPSPVAETEARAALLAVALTLSPSVEDTAPGLCTSDLRAHAPPHELSVATAVTRLQQLGLPATAGIARTPLLAVYAAKAERSPSAVSNPRALDQSDDSAEDAPGWLFDEPSAPYLSLPGPVLTVRNEASFLAQLPLSVADPTPEFITVFAHWGLRTLGDLTTLPREEIVRRFGLAGLDLWNRAAGGDVRPLHLVVPKRDFQAAVTFEQSIESLEPLLFILRRLLDRLTLELRTSHSVASAVALTLRLEDDAHHTRDVRLHTPTADPATLFRALHISLESLSTTAPIRALEINLTPTRPLIRQHGLFETSLRDPHGFAETLARVAALVGSSHIGTPSVANTHRPDSHQLQPPTAVIPPAADPNVHMALGLPLRRFRPPLPATLEFAPPERKPTYLFTKNFQGDITGIRGPWRSSGDWWQTDLAWSRCEWDVALATGGLYRLLLIGDAWFVEGEYD